VESSVTKDSNVTIPVKVPLSEEPEHKEAKSFGVMVQKRLLVNKGAVVGIIILLIFIFLAILAPVLAQFPVEKMNYGDRFMPPGGKHLLGTDEFGRDIFSRMLFGWYIFRYSFWLFPKT
jgi:peptide/nickel transport system permease protein